MNYEDKNSFPGYIYFRDNERDYKIGLTNNLVVRGRAYKTENPRDTVRDFFFVETYAEAEAIEAEMKQAARAEGLCSFDKSDEWLENTEDTEAFWDGFLKQYAKKSYGEWSEYFEAEHAAVVDELNAEINDINLSLKESTSLVRKLQRQVKNLEEKSEDAKTHGEWTSSLFPMGESPTRDARKIVKRFKEHFVSTLPTEEARLNWQGWTFASMCCTKPIRLEDAKNFEAIYDEAHKNWSHWRTHTTNLEAQLANLRKENERLVETARSWRKQASDLKIFKDDLQSKYDELKPKSSDSPVLSAMLSHT